MNSYILPVFVSIALHAIIVLVVTYGWEASSQKPTVKMPRYVEAKLVQLKAKTPDKKPPKPKTRKVDLTKKRQQQAALERKRRLEAEKKRKLALKKRKEKEKREKEAREKKEKEKREREKKEQARLAELEKQRQLEQQEQERRQQAIEQELAEEESLLLEEQYAMTAQSYTALIAARIEQNWSRPPSARKGMQCELVLQLVPTGKVVNVSISQSSGNSAFDRSAMQAVKKIERFTELQEMPPEIFERYFRQFRLVFNPKDLRQ